MDTPYELAHLLDYEEKRSILIQVVTEQRQQLMHSIQIQVQRFGLAQGMDSVNSLAEDILHDTVVQALRNVEKFNPTHRPLPWLSKIALNEARQLLRRRKTERKNVTLLRDDSKVKRLTEEGNADVISDDEIFDMLYQPSNVSQLSLNELLSLVNNDDREILEFAFVHGYQGKSLAEKLNISEAAAWKRQSRAIKRLRDALNQSETLIKGTK